MMYVSTRNSKADKWKARIEDMTIAHNTCVEALYMIANSEDHQLTSRSDYGLRITMRDLIITLEEVEGPRLVN